VPATFTYPTSADLQLIEQDFAPRLMADRPIFGLFPETTEDAWVLMWDQQDAYTGLLAARGLNNEPPRVKKTPGKRFAVTPGVYGEFMPIDEAELTTRRRWGSFNAPVDVADLVVQAQDNLLQRDYDRREWMGWTMLATGTFSVAGPTGAVLHTDSYATQTYAAPVPWSTAATSAPLQDFRNVQLLSRGYSVWFDRRARAYMNQTTMNSLLSNTNNADLYGRRTAGLGTFNNVDQISQLFMGDNLPELVVNDDVWKDDTGANNLFIPNGIVLVVGRRKSGVPVGDFVLAKNANNDGEAPGAYTKVIDKGEYQVPRTVEVHRGWNGLCRLLFPSAIVRMAV
jgi:hypothetical protein